VDFFFRHYNSGCYMPERVRIHDATSNAFLISPTPSERNTAAFEYRNEAELFSVTSWKSKGRAVRYRRFSIAAEAIRFAIEELGRKRLAGVCLEVDEERFDGTRIRRLYDSDDYPLTRRPASLLA
jgi:hypothetical protein